MFKRCLLVVALVALVLATAAEAKVSLLHVTSSVSAGAYATLTVKVSRPTRCSITVIYYSGPSEAQGLFPKPIDPGTRELDLEGWDEDDTGALADSRQLRCGRIASDLVPRHLR